MSILTDGPAPTARRDGEGYKWIKQAAQFQRAMNRCVTDRQRTALSLECPALFWARWVYLKASSPFKYAIEAHLLARESNREIAFKNGCSLEVVEAYEQLFFNVRERLAHREYIVNVVMGEAVHRGLHERSYDLLWKLFGYAAGPCVLDTMIGRLPLLCWTHRPEDVPSFFQDTAISLMKQKATIAALTVPVNSSTHIDLIAAFVKYVEVERTTDSLGKTQEQIISNINSVLGAIPFAVAQPGGVPSGYLAAYDASAAELRSDEMMLAAAGIPLPGHRMLLDLKFPETTSP